MTSNTLLEILLYCLVGGYSIYSAVSVPDMALSLFCGGALLACFTGSAWSLYKMIVRGW